MCRDGDNGAHSCFGDCPVCWSFTITNLFIISHAENVELGSLGLFMEIAREGCQLCTVIVKMAEASGRVCDASLGMSFADSFT